MDIRRVALYGALFVVVYSLWMSWQKDYPQPLHQQATLASVVPGEAKEGFSLAHHQEGAVSTGSIDIETDVLALKLSRENGNIISATLRDYPVSVEDKTPFELLYLQPTQQYTANSDLLIKDNQSITPLKVMFDSQKSTYRLENNDETLVVVLSGQLENGTGIQKTYTLKRGSYLIDVAYTVANAQENELTLYYNTSLARTEPESQSSFLAVGSYTGASYANPGVTRYKKVSFKDMGKGNLDVDVKDGWIAMQQHYFLSAWVPTPSSANKFYTRVDDGRYTIGAVSQPLHIAPNGQSEVKAQLYLGPEVASSLAAIAPGLDLTIDYGWLWFLSSFLFTLMQTIYNFIGNWGWAIVLVTVAIKLLFFRLSATSYKSMAGMRKLQPKLLELRERFGDDKARLSQATMELYRQEKVNPLGGCLPILIQIPVFIALYWVLLESVELRQAPFIFWIKDLASADPYHVLPIIMGGTMLVQQKLNPAPPDPMQAKMMMMLPIVFTGLFWSFPAGLVLYWIVNNTLSILQQWYITQKYSKDVPLIKGSKA